MHWGGEQDRLTEEQLALHKLHLARMSDMELQRSYEIYARALVLDKGQPPIPAKVQYFVGCWRELRGRRRSKSRRFTEHSAAICV